MNWTRKCRCTYHELSMSHTCAENENSMFNLKSKTVDPIARRRIKEKNLIKETNVKTREIFVCRNCVTYIQNDDLYRSLSSNSTKSLVSVKAKTKNPPVKKRGRPAQGTISHRNFMYHVLQLKKIEKYLIIIFYSFNYSD